MTSYVCILNWSFHTPYARKTIKISNNSGKGIHVWKNKSVYNGDWKNDLRDGFGTLSIKNANTDDVLKRYSGEWMTNKKHVC